MGYTHYWSAKTKIDNNTYQQALKDIKTIIKAKDNILANGLGDKGTKPDIKDKDCICFNGIGDLSHETFSLPSQANELKSFEFCKTDCKPYDEVVVACLTVLHNYCPEIQISSDGDLCDLDAGLNLARKVLKNKELVNIYDPIPCNAEKFIKKI